MENHVGIQNENVTEIMIAGVRLHNLPPEAVSDVVQELSGRTAPQRVVFVTTFDIIRSWFSQGFRRRLETAALVLPLQKGVQRAAAIAGLERPNRHMPFQLIIKLLGAVEDQQGSLYVIGGKAYQLEKAESNLKYTFPKLRIVGRFRGHFNRAMESSLLTAARKSSPDLLLVGNGVRGGDKWLVKHSGSLPGAICVSAPKVFEVFAERRRRPSRRLFSSGLGDTARAILLPWHWLSIPFYLIMLIRLLIERLSRKAATT